MMTASASAANSNGCCALTTTPYMDVIISDGLVISARHPGRSTRLMMCDATNESISLNPSKVTTATLMLFTPGNNLASTDYTDYADSALSLTVHLFFRIGVICVTGGFVNA